MQSQERVTPCPKCGYEAKLERIQVTYSPNINKALPNVDMQVSVYRYRCENPVCGHQFERAVGDCEDLGISPKF